MHDLELQHLLVSTQIRLSSRPLCALQIVFYCIVLYIICRLCCLSVSAREMNSPRMISCSSWPAASAWRTSTWTLPAAGCRTNAGMNSAAWTDYQKHSKAFGELSFSLPFLTCHIVLDYYWCCWVVFSSETACVYQIRRKLGTIVCLWRYRIVDKWYIL